MALLVCLSDDLLVYLNIVSTLAITTIDANAYIASSLSAIDIGIRSSES